MAAKENLRQNATQNTRKKKKGSGWGMLMVLLFLLLPRLFESTDSGALRHFYLRNIYFPLRRAGLHLDPELVVALVTVGFTILMLLVIIGIVRRKVAAAASPSPVKSGRGANAGRVSAAVQRPDPRNRSFTPPEPSCIVCDHTGEDHFARDRANRIAQLNDWLRSGLIDRNEYRVLKDRYERDI